MAQNESRKAFFEAGINDVESCMIVRDQAISVSSRLGTSLYTVTIWSPEGEKVSLTMDDYEFDQLRNLMGSIL